MSDLIARFDAVVPDQWEPHAEPTKDSVAVIEKHFGCHLPPLLLEFASKSKSFSSFFLGLGPDYADHRHIISRNQMVRSHPDWLAEGPGAPDHLVFITDNFMNDFFWCLDLRKPDGEHPISFWAPQSLQPTSDVYACFADFISAQIVFYQSNRGK